MTTTRPFLTGTAFGVLTAWVTNLAIFLVADIGAPVRVVTGWAPDGADLTVVDILITSAVAIVAAGMALWAWEYRSPRARDRWSVAVMVLAALSALPLWRLDVDTGSKTALSLMHLATGACAILGQGLRPARRIASRTKHRASRESLV